MQATLTERLRLEPITPQHGHDLWLIHNDDQVARWYGGAKPKEEEARERAVAMAYSWREFGVHKWMAYDRQTGDLVGRGGPSPTPADADWGRVHEFLPKQSWVGEVRRGPRGDAVHVNWLEIGWALRPQFWGLGYATELGSAGLAYAFDVLHMRAVVSCTDNNNVASIAVMERLGMTYAGTLPDLDGGADLTVYTKLLQSLRAIRLGRWRVTAGATSHAERRSRVAGTTTAAAQNARRLAPQETDRVQAIPGGDRQSRSPHRVGVSVRSRRGSPAPR